MSKVVILGSGFAGQTAALNLRKHLSSSDEVHVISPMSYFQYTPDLVWVGVGHMAGERCVFELAPIYKKQGIKFTRGRVVEINVESKVVHTEQGDQVAYDYLINATGPYLNFEGTPGLGPERGATTSICTLPHALEARDKYFAAIEKMKTGQRQRIVVGTGHLGSTCQGAAFEYLQNIHFDLIDKKLRNLCDLIWFSNEPQLGDLGMGGFVFKIRNELRSSNELTTWLMKECNIETMTATAPTKIEPGKIHWENAQGEEGVLEFDFAMLIPQFLGQPIRYVNDAGVDLSGQYTNPARLFKVDANYDAATKPYEMWSPQDWPSTYQSSIDPYLFAAGIAFAPPHPISPPSGTTKSGMKIQAAPPRTGMIAGMTGKVAADNILRLIQGKGQDALKKLPMSKMPAACIASQRMSIFDGSAIMTSLYPVVPDFETYPKEYGGRDLEITTYEIGKGNAWIKMVLHHMFQYKMKARPGWSFIPE